MTIYFADGKAFLEVAENYLMYIGDEEFIRALSMNELRDLAQAIMLEIKFGSRQMPVGLPTSNLVH